jgi:hypothetical protein
MEAGSGIEPLYTDLQSVASPLCHPAGSGGDIGAAAVLPQGIPIHIFKPFQPTGI